MIFDVIQVCISNEARRTPSPAAPGTSWGKALEQADLFAALLVWLCIFLELQSLVDITHDFPVPQTMVYHILSPCSTMFCGHHH